MSEPRGAGQREVVSPAPLYLLPASLGPSEWTSTLPQGAWELAAGLNYFIVENAKTARAELQRLALPGRIQDMEIVEFPRSATSAELDALLLPLTIGRSGALMSEAGCPAVADPGSNLVLRAHLARIPVRPLVGPSSILLALMASGLNGQSFSFHGYLAKEGEDCVKQLRELEAESRAKGRTQIFIETPYRNARMFAHVLEACRGDTLICIATDITTADESIHTRSVEAWRAQPPPTLDRRPTLFLLLAPSGSREVRSSRAGRSSRSRFRVK